MAAGNTQDHQGVRVQGEVPPAHGRGCGHWRRDRYHEERPSLFRGSCALPREAEDRWFGHRSGHQVQIHGDIVPSLSMSNGMPKPEGTGTCLDAVLRRDAGTGRGHGLGGGRLDAWRARRAIDRAVQVRGTWQSSDHLASGRSGCYRTRAGSHCCGTSLVLAFRRLIVGGSRRGARGRARSPCAPDSLQDLARRSHADPHHRRRRLLENVIVLVTIRPATVALDWPGNREFCCRTPRSRRLLLAVLAPPLRPDRSWRARSSRCASCSARRAGPCQSSRRSPRPGWPRRSRRAPSTRR